MFAQQSKLYTFYAINLDDFIIRERASRQYQLDHFDFVNILQVPHPRTSPEGNIDTPRITLRLDIHFLWPTLVITHLRSSSCVLLVENRDDLYVFLPASLPHIPYRPWTNWS
jgi:hypothetical protein